jgi:ferredoxin
MVLLLRSVMLWGRGFDPAFNLWILGPDARRSAPRRRSRSAPIYELLKDITASMVVFGALVFLYFRVVKAERRMTLSGEGVLILAIIVTMMLADMVYDGASRCSTRSTRAPPPARSSPRTSARASSRDRAPRRPATGEGKLAWHLYPNPAGSLLRFRPRKGRPAEPRALRARRLLGPLDAGARSSRTSSRTPSTSTSSRRSPTSSRATSTRPAASLSSRQRRGDRRAGDEGLRGAREVAEPVGVARIEQFTWKAILDFYTCTECGRCSDNCPAHKTGKMLSPKQLTLNLRDHLYGREHRVHRATGGPVAHGREPTRRTITTATTITPTAMRRTRTTITGTVTTITATTTTTITAITRPSTPTTRCPSRTSPRSDRPRPQRHPPRRALGLHDVPRLRGAVPGDDQLRRQDRRHAPQPRDGEGRVPGRARGAVPGDRGQRQPVEPRAHRSRQLGRGPGRPDDERQPDARCSTGSAARRATTTARRRSRAPRRS